MEEVAVPIIEITQKASNIEAFIVDESRVLTLGAKEYAIIKIYVGIRAKKASFLLISLMVAVFSHLDSSLKLRKRECHRIICSIFRGKNK